MGDGSSSGNHYVAFKTWVILVEGEIYFGIWMLNQNNCPLSWICQIFLTYC